MTKSGHMRISAKIVYTTEKRKCVTKQASLNGTRYGCHQRRYVRSPAKVPYIWIDRMREQCPTEALTCTSPYTRTTQISYTYSQNLNRSRWSHPIHTAPFEPSIGSFARFQPNLVHRKRRVYLLDIKLTSCQQQTADQEGSSTMLMHMDSQNMCMQHIQTFLFARLLSQNPHPYFGSS